MISVQERATALARAQAALRQLEQDRAISLRRLGVARDQLNIVWTRTARTAVWEAVRDLEASAAEGKEGRNSPT